MDNYSVSVASYEDKEVWDSFVDQSDQSSIFHYYDWLKCAEEESGYQLIPLVIEHGKNRICQFPIFFKKKWGFTIACSPPPGCAIPHLGLVFNYSSDNQRRMESVNHKSVRAIFDYLNIKSSDYCRFAFTPEFGDIRPFIWHGFASSVNYTYRMELAGKKIEEISAGYEGKVRNMIRRFESNFPDGKLKEIPIGKIIEQVKTRYSEKNREHSISTSYFKSVQNAMGERIEPLGVLVDNECINGSVNLHHHNGTLGWVGSTSVISKYNGVNEFMRDRIIRDLVQKGVPFFESVGANTEHLCKKSSRYNFRPSPYYIVEKINQKAKWALKATKIMGIRGPGIQKII